MKPLDAGLAAAIDARVQDAMERQQIPGLSLAIGSSGIVRYARGYGNRSVRDALPVNEHTRFKIASVTKQFNAALIMRAVERGLLALDSPLRTFVPEIPFDDVRITDLLGHTSGIASFDDAPDFDLRMSAPYRAEDVVAAIAEMPSSFEPGTRYEYSNSNYVLLSQIAERVFGQAFEEALRTEVIARAQLEETDYDDPTLLAPNRAEGHTRFALGPLERAGCGWHANWERGTGSLISSATDLVRWNGALRSGRIVTPESYAAMTTSRIASGAHTGYGFGIGINDFGGSLIELRHTGELPGFTSDLVAYPEHDLDIAVLANVDQLVMYFSIVRPILALVAAREDLMLSPPDGPMVPFDPAFSFAPFNDICAKVCNGNIEGLPLSGRLRRFLTSSRLEQLRRIAALGPLADVRPIHIVRRAPNTSVAYRARLGTQEAVVAIGLCDDGSLEYIRIAEFFAW